MTTYSIYSQYYTTGIAQGKYLDFWKQRPIPSRSNDVLFEINTIYNLRPDLLANDLYGNSKLWWIFAERNPNVLKDPLGDFILGIKIFLPQKDLLFSALGL